MLDYIFKRPMLLSGLFCILIAVIGYYFKSSLYIIAIILILTLMVLLYKETDISQVLAFILAFIMTVSMLLSLSRIEGLQKNIDETYNLKCIMNDIEYEGEYNRAVIEVAEKAALPRGTKIKVTYESIDIKIGQVIKADIKISEISDKYKKSDYAKSIYLNGRMSKIEILENERDVVLSFISGMREYIRQTIFENLDYREAAILCALIFGDRSDFSDKFYANVTASGVNHVMVVSGMHLAVIVSILLGAVERLIYNRYIRAICMVSVVLLLTALCGFTMSILRAGITYAFVALAQILNRKSNSENTLGAATTVILIFSPFAIFSVAFQLSMLSTFGILVIAIPIIDFIRDREIIKSKMVFWLISSSIITLSAMLVTLPVSISVFGSVSIVALLPNLLITPIIKYILFLAIVALILNLISPVLSTVVFTQLDTMVKYINIVISYFGRIEWAVIELPKYSAFIVAVLIIIVFWNLIACKKLFYMVKLIDVKNKIIKEGGKRLKWR